MRRIPSLNALRAFDAAARHLSCARAADELHVTPGAISRQIRALEDHLGLELFQRIHQRLSLTEAGAGYLQEIRASLDRIENATAELKARSERSSRFNLWVLATFGTEWLIPRLPSFAQSFPRYEINITTFTGHIHFSEHDDVDAAVSFGTGVWADALSDLLMNDVVVPVCSPRLLTGLNPLRRPADLHRVRFLHHNVIPNAWKEWLDAAGVPSVDASAGPQFEQFSMVIQAARIGMGIGLVPRLLAEEHLASGKLVIPFELAVQCDLSYWLVYPRQKSSAPALRAFRKWILAEAASAGGPAMPDVVVPSRRIVFEPADARAARA
jgi:DNA-binding transcriptional LysR family regulator